MRCICKHLGKGINIIPGQKMCLSSYMKLLAVEPLWHNNLTEEILKSDTEEEILDKNCKKIEK